VKILPLVRTFYGIDVIVLIACAPLVVCFLFCVFSVFVSFLYCFVYCFFFCI